MNGSIVGLLEYSYPPLSSNLRTQVMGITEENEIRALVNMALSSTDISTAAGCLLRARLLQPEGRLEPGYGFVSGNESPEAYLDERRELITEAFAAGGRLIDVAKTYSCSLSTVGKIKQELMKEEAA